MNSKQLPSDDLRPEEEPLKGLSEAHAEGEIGLPRPKKRNWPLILAIAAVLVLGYIGVKPRLERTQKLDSEVAALKAELPVVSVVSLKRVRGASEVALPSNLQAIEETTIDARTSGYVKARYVDIGSKVKAGQVLADIESPEMDQQVMSAQSQVSKSQAGVGQAVADVSRLQSGIASAESQIALFASNVGQARADLKHLQAKDLEAASAINVAKARLTQAQKRLDGSNAELQRAKVGRDIASKTLVRWKELFRADAVSGQDVDEKQSDYDSSLAKVDAAQADVNSAQADVVASESVVKSQVAEESAAKADVTSGQEKIQAAQAALRSAQANYKSAIAARDASNANVNAAQAAVGSDQANVRRYQSLQGFEHVVAPFAGVITARNIDTGDLVNAGGAGSGASNPMNTVTTRGLFGLARTDTLLAQANVPEDSVSSIKEGQDAEVTTSEHPGKVFHGKVFHVSGALDMVSRTLLVEVKIPNANNELIPGMFAQIRFLGAQAGSTIRIPATGLIFDSKGTRVATVASDDRLHFVPVKLGRDFGGEIEVLQGLSGDETLVTNPNDSLSEGEKVKPIKGGK
jgi:RND family efflux transporter MFP subunit